MNVAPYRTIAIAAAVLMGPVVASAQTSATVSASVTIPQVLYVAIDKATVSFPAPGASDYAAGYVDANAGDNDATLTHRGNVPHSVYVSTTSEHFDAVDAANDGVKPSSHLMWDVDNAGAFAGVTFTADPEDDADAVVAGASPGVGSAEVDYRLALDYTTDAPDTYTLDFVYTIIAD